MGRRRGKEENGGGRKESVEAACKVKILSQNTRKGIKIWEE